MKKFEITWKNGEKEILEGKSIINALMNNFYDNSIVSWMESYKEVKPA